MIKKGEVTIPYEGRMVTLKITKALRGRNKRRLEQLGLTRDA